MNSSTNSRRTQPAEEMGGINGFERSFHGTTSSSHIGGYTGGHTAESLKIQQAVAPRTTRSRKKDQVDLTRIDSDDLGTKGR